MAFDEGTTKWFDAPGVSRIPRQHTDIIDEPTSPDAELKVLGHAYIDTVNDIRRSAGLGATAFDALMIRSAIESA